LASCQSAGVGEAVPGNQALSALGARLIEAGVPAVLAMQGNVSLETINQFMPVFFQELSRDGLIDRAVAVARSQVSARPDAWMPVLWMRLRDGRLWYTPGFTGDRPGFDRWPGFMKSLQQGICTPIIGPAMSEFLIGSSRQIARHWAEESSYPASDDSTESLPQVAQYLANVQATPYYPRDKLVETVGENIRLQFGSTSPAAAAGLSVAGMIDSFSKQLWSEQAEEAHWILAHLPIPIYINTNPDSLLVSALRLAGKEPVVDYCRWHPELENLPKSYPADYYPEVDRPLVYHLFGVLEQPASLVVSEDDYFDYLMWVKPPNSIPTVVDQALGSNSLLFLGFEVYDWSFRVVFRSILDEQRRLYKRHYPSLAVQVSPSKEQVDPARLRTYLEQFFQGAQMGVYIGTASDFTKEIWHRWQNESAS